MKIPSSVDKVAILSMLEGPLGLVRTGGIYLFSVRSSLL